jgi:IMP cyclohydrolase
MKSPFKNQAHVMITFIGGRSKSSKNRRYERAADGSIRTAFIEPCEDDPSLIIYPAMTNSLSSTDFVASNGHQTSAIIDGFFNGESHQSTIEDWNYEPDAPNFTPRISASLELLTNQPPRTILSRISKAPESDYLKWIDDEMKPDNLRSSWSVPSMLGIGYMLTTYAGDGDPIPSYLGDPMTIPLEGTPEEMLTTVWHALNKDTRVGICLRIIDGVTGEYRTFIKNSVNEIIEV